MDEKRRVLVPQEFRAAASGVDAAAFDGVYCFPAIGADCIEAGGQALFDRYAALVDGLPFGDPLREAMEDTVFGGMKQLSYDGAGRITLPEVLCQGFGPRDWVIIVGLRNRFQIWSRDTYQAHREKQRLVAREGLPTYSMAQRTGSAAA